MSPCCLQIASHLREYSAHRNQHDAQKARHSEALFQNNQSEQIHEQRIAAGDGDHVCGRREREGYVVDRVASGKTTGGAESGGPDPRVEKIFLAALVEEPPQQQAAGT